MQVVHRLHEWIIATRVRIYTVLVLISIVPLALFLYCSDRYLHRNTTRQVTEKIQETSDLVARRFEERFASTTTLVDSFATRPSLAQASETGNYEEIVRQIRQIQGLASGATAVALFGVKGDLRAVYPDVGQDHYRRSGSLAWYTDAMRSETAYVSDVVEEPKGTTSEFAVAMPVRDGNGQTTALLAIFYPTNAIQNWAAGFGPNMTRFLFLVDRKGNAVSTKDLSLASGHQSLGRIEPVQQVLAGKSGSGIFKLDGQSYQAAYKPIGAVGWGVVVAIPYSDIDRAVSEFERPLTAIAVIFLFAAVGLGSLGANLWRRLRDTERQTRTVIETAQDGFVAFDDEGVITDWNHEAEYIFGWSREEAVTTLLQKLVMPDRLREAQWAKLVGFRSLGSGAPRGKRLELTLSHRSGHQFPVEVSMAAVPQGNKRYFNAFFRDISEQQEYKNAVEQKNRELDLRNREVERANNLKSQFLASMSHELRTPLNAILGFSELLSDNSASTLTEKQSRWIDHIGKAGKHLLQLINDILDLAKIEAGQVELDIESFEVGATLPEVISNIRHLAIVKKISLEIDCSPSLRIKADRLRFKQILYNLLSNAIKFSPEGGSIRVESKEDNRHAEFSVVDTGVGIRAEDLNVIFDEFRQVGNSTRGVREGTGLGLAITKRLVEQQNGSIRVESTFGEGSKFTFTMPVADDLSEAAPLEVSTLAVEAARPLVLIVDDEPAACELIAGYLNPEGYATATAHSGIQAVNLARTLKPRCITLDILMPSGSGWETLHELRQNRETKSIPIIVVSVVDQRRLGMALGASDYLIKPIQRETLIGAIERHVRVRGQSSLHCVAADDDPAALRLMADTLADVGFSVELATSGRDALKAMRAKHTDLLLLDLVMPEMNGFEVLKELADDPALCNIPTLVLTAKALSRQEIEQLDRSTRAVLQKNGEWRVRLLQNLQKLVGKTASPTSEGA